MEDDNDTIEEESQEEEEEESTGKQRRNKGWDNIKPYQFKPGQSGNPSGRPKGPSMKEWTKLMLASMTEEERLDFLKGQNKTDIWKMGEGAPDTKSEVKQETKHTGEITVSQKEIAEKFEEELKKTL